MTDPFLRTLGRRLAAADQAEHVDDLHAEARGTWPDNFVVQLVARTASKIGDVLASPRHVLTWWLGALGVPPGLLGALVPIREAGALLPQLWLGRFMARRAYRRGVYVTGLFVQAAAIGAIALAASSSRGTLLGVLAVVSIGVFSVGRAAASLSSKDLLGRTVPNGRRGRLGGTASSVAGLLTLAAGLTLGLRRTEDPGVAPLVLVVGAVVAWAVAGWLARSIEEPPAEVDGDGASIRNGLRLLRDDPDFGRFCLARGLLAGTVLSMPYVTMLASRGTDGASAGLGALLVAASAAQFVSGWLWGRAADLSSRRTLIVGGLAAAAVLATVFVVAALGLEGTLAAVVFGILYFLLALAHEGIRQGRKTYVVDLAPDDLRPLYVAVANTVMGSVLVLSTALGAVASAYSERTLVALLALLGVAGSLVALRLREVEAD